MSISVWDRSQETLARVMFRKYRLFGTKNIALEMLVISL